MDFNDFFAWHLVKRGRGGEMNNLKVPSTPLIAHGPLVVLLRVVHIHIVKSIQRFCKLSELNVRH